MAALVPLLESMQEHLPPSALVPSNCIPEHPHSQLHQLHEAQGHPAETEPPELGLSLGKKGGKQPRLFVTVIRALLCHTSYVSLSTHNYSLHDYSCRTAYSLPETELHLSSLSLLRKAPGTARCFPMQLCYSDTLAARWAICHPPRHFLKYLVHTDIIHCPLMLLKCQMLLISCPSWATHCLASPYLPGATLLALLLHLQGPSPLGWRKKIC